MTAETVQTLDLLGAGTFEFALDLTHPLFGELLHQTGSYRDQHS